MRWGRRPDVKNLLVDGFTTKIACHNRKQVREAGIKPVIARRGEQHDSGLGVYRWVVEQGFAPLHWFRRLRIRWEIRDDIHEAFLRSPAPSSAGDASVTSQTVRSSFQGTTARSR